MCCKYLLEIPQKGDFNVYMQHTFWWRKKLNVIKILNLSRSLHPRRDCHNDYSHYGEDASLLIGKCEIFGSEALVSRK